MIFSREEINFPGVFIAFEEKPFRMKSNRL